MPSMGDVISLSQGLYAPAIFTALLMFVSGAFLNSVRMVQDLVDRIEKLVSKDEGGHGATRLIAYIFLFFLSPMVFRIIGALSPVSLSFPHNFAFLDDSSRSRLAQIWCSFLGIERPWELRDFVFSVAAEHGTDQSSIIIPDSLLTLLSQFNQGVTILLVLLLSAAVALAWPKYRTFRWLNLLGSVALGVLMIGQTYAAQRGTHGSAGHAIIISAYSRLLAEGRLRPLDPRCVEAKVAALRQDARTGQIGIRLRMPPVYSIIPVDTGRNRAGREKE